MILVAFIVLSFVVTSCIAGGTTYSENWVYDRSQIDPNGPKYGPYIWKDWVAPYGGAPTTICDGTRADAQQSPIDIEVASAQYAPSSPLSFTFNAANGVNSVNPTPGAYNLDSGVCDSTGKCNNLPLVNGGWSYQSTIPTNAVRLSGGYFGTESFFLNNVHMHRISEHTFDGGHNPVEYHMVFMSTATCPYYACCDEVSAENGICPTASTTPCAAGTSCFDFCSSFGYTDGCLYMQNDEHSLAILSIHFEEVEGAPDHPLLTPIVDAIMNGAYTYEGTSAANMQQENTATTSSSPPTTLGFEFITDTFDFSFLNDASMANYFHYDGAITIPPCVEVTRWTVFETIQPANGVQLQAFIGNFPVEDNRPTQPLNNRIVYTNNPAYDKSTKPIDNGKDKNNNNSKNHHVSDGGVAGIAVACFVFGVALAVGYEIRRRSSHTRIITPTGSQKGSSEVNIN